MADSTGSVQALPGRGRRRIAGWAGRLLAGASGIAAAGTAAEAGGRMRRPAPP